MLDASVLKRCMKLMMNCRRAMTGCRVSVLAMFCGGCLYAHADAPLTDSIPDPEVTFHTDTVRSSIFKERILFPKAFAVVQPDFADNSDRIDSIRSFLSDDDTHDFLSVKVTGLYSPEGEYAFNTALAHARARALADLVRSLNPAVTVATDIRHPSKETPKAHYREQRRAELEIVYRNNTSTIAVESDSITHKATDTDADIFTTLSETQLCDTVTAVSGADTGVSATAQSVGVLPPPIS